MKKYFGELDVLDLWKALNQVHYLGIGLTFIDSDWKLWAITLAVRPLRLEHTATNIKEMVAEILDEFKIIPICFC
jgi:hypothetical protein